MAEITETLRPFDNSMKSTFINFTLRENRYPEKGDDGEPHPNAGELLAAPDRVYFEKPDQRDRSDGLELKFENKTLKLDGTLDTMTEAEVATLFTLLRQAYNATANVEE